MSVMAYHERIEVEGRIWDVMVDPPVIEARGLNREGELVTFMKALPEGELNVRRVEELIRKAGGWAGADSSAET